LEISWGDLWRTRIDAALSESSFFIPVITPRYFRSVECRRELITFAGHAKSLGRDELLLPVYYVDVPELAEDSADEAAALVAKTHWVDWRNLRLSSESSGSYRREVNKLARRLAEVYDRLSSDVVSVHSASPDVSATPEAEDSEPGFMDLLAAGEETLPKWQSTIERFAEVLNQLSDVAREATRGIEKSDARGAGFAGRLMLIRQFAQMLEEPANSILQLGNDYAAYLVEIDPAILTLIRLAEQDPAEAQSDGARELFESIRTLAGAASQNAAALAEFTGSLKQTATISKDLRPPVRKIQEGLRGVLDAQSIIDEWDSRISGLGIESKSA
jgi:hypothetical protein